MPFDTSPRARRSGRRSLSKAPPGPPDVTLGVFSFDGGWKVYSQFGRALSYPSRDEALGVAQARAFEALRAGRRVELFVQDEDGAFHQADLELH
jgi:hypothetical protein